MFQLVLVNTLEQWVDECTSLRGEDEPSMLDLVFTKKPESQPDIKYLHQMGKSDHVMLEIELQDSSMESRNEVHREGRLNHAKSNFVELRIFLGVLNGRKYWKARQYRRSMIHSYINTQRE